MNSRGSRSKSFRYCIGILVASILDVTKDGLYGEIPGSTMDEGSDDLSRLSIEDLKPRSWTGGSRGQPAVPMKKRRKIGSGLTTRSSGGFGRSSGCIKTQSRELSARAAPQPLEREFSQYEDPLEREKSPRERLRRKFQIETSPLERPRARSSGPCPEWRRVSLRNWLFLMGWFLIRDYLLFLLLLIVLFLGYYYLYCFWWAFHLRLVLMGAYFWL